MFEKVFGADGGGVLKTKTIFDEFCWFTAQKSLCRAPCATHVFARFVRVLEVNFVSNEPGAGWRQPIDSDARAVCRGSAVCRSTLVLNRGMVGQG